MRVLTKSDGNPEIFLEEAQNEAEKSMCLERRCGAVLVRGNVIIGRGFNSPPGNLESQRRCGQDKSTLNERVTEKTCCVHAERRALSNALKKYRDISRSIMYFTSIDEHGNRIFSGKPYCTDCSKACLDEGIIAWVLEHAEGVTIYNAEEYNDISFNYGKESPQNL